MKMLICVFAASEFLLVVTAIFTVRSSFLNCNIVAAGEDKKAKSVSLNPSSISSPLHKQSVNLSLEAVEANEFCLAPALALLWETPMFYCKKSCLMSVGLMMRRPPLWLWSQIAHRCCTPPKCPLFTIST